jgi:SAM-dependent methyltransferase
MIRSVTQFRVPPHSCAAFAFLFRPDASNLSGCGFRISSAARFFDPPRHYSPVMNIFTNRSCPNCDRPDGDVIVEMQAGRVAENSYSRRFFTEHLGFPEDTLFPIVRCRQCRFVYSQRLLDSSLLNALYERMISEENDRRHEESLYMTRVYSGIFTLLLNSGAGKEPRNSPLKLLDFGGGTGAFCQVASAPQIDPVCFETSERRLRLIRAKGLNVIDQFDQIAAHGPYDMILCNQVLEHVPQPKDILRTFARILSPGGSAYLAVPAYPDEILARNAERYRSGDKYPLDLNPWEHLNYFSPESFRVMLEDCGLAPYIWPLPEVDLGGEKAVCGFMANAHPALPWTCAIARKAP